jgi:replicative DNA helicase
MAEPIPLYPATVEDPGVRIEQSLLGAMIANPAKAIALLPATFQSAHYADELHRDLHDTIVATGVTGGDVLGQLAGASDQERGYIASLLAAYISLGHVPGLAESITETHHRRGLIMVAEQMLCDVKRATRDAPAHGIMVQAMTALDALVSGTRRYGSGQMLDPAMDAALAHAQAAARGEVMSGRSTGMATVDDALGGLDVGTFNVLGARPGAGKTALACQWAISIARQCKLEGGTGVLGFSLEMPAKALGRRVLAHAAGVSVTDLKRGRIDGRIEALTRARHELAGLPLWIEDAGGQGLPAIRQKSRAALRRFGKIALIWVDHIQIVAPEEVDRRNGGTQAVGRVSNALRDLSKEFECPVLCLSQLSRGLLQRDDKRPNLGDLRQAGDIEQDADSVMFLHREEMFLSDREPPRAKGQKADKHAASIEEWRDGKAKLRGKAELILAKVRDGEPCTVDLKFDGATTSFSEPPKQAAFDDIPPNLGDWDDRYV